MSARAPLAAKGCGYGSDTGQNGLRQLPYPECGRIQTELLAETCAHGECMVGALCGPRGLSEG